MLPDDAFILFDSLTDKQRETLDLAARQLTSKQIALKLGVAPVTIDKRIEGLRGRLGNIARPELLRLFRQWDRNYDHIIDDPIILGPAISEAQHPGTQPADIGLMFADSIDFDARASWSRDPVSLRPGLKPSDLGVLGKLLAIILGAVAIMAVAVLLMAFADALLRVLDR